MRPEDFQHSVCIALATSLWFPDDAHNAGFDDEEAPGRLLICFKELMHPARQQSKSSLWSPSGPRKKTRLRQALIELQINLKPYVLMSPDSVANEQVARDVADMQRKQKDDAQALNDRLRKLEPSKITWDGREFQVEQSEKRDFDLAMAAFRKGDFANAEVLFVDFMNRNPQSGYRPSALFWLGNAQYATKDYKDALANFRSLVAQTPDHMRVPEAMLAIANCQLEVKDTKGARKTLEDLVASHPGTEASAAAKERLARLK